MQRLYKIEILLLFVIVSFSQKVTSSAPDSVYIQANAAYTSADYQKAVDLYKQLIFNGIESAEVYFNLGNAYYKQNKLPFAILHYEKAKLIDPYDEDINYNLQLANTFKVDQIKEIPEFFLKTWLTKLTLWLSFENWAILSIVVFVIFIVFTIIYLFTGRTGLKKVSFIIAVLGIILSLSFFTLAHKRHNIQFARNTAIITASSVTIKGSPDVSGTDLFVVHEGTKVNIDDQVGDWYEIRISDGNKGWISKKELEII